MDLRGFISALSIVGAASVQGAVDGGLDASQPRRGRREVVVVSRGSREPPTEGDAINTQEPHLQPHP